MKLNQTCTHLLSHFFQRGLVEPITAFHAIQEFKFELRIVREIAEFREIGYTWAFGAWIVRNELVSVQGVKFIKSDCKWTAKAIFRVPTLT